MLEIHEWVKEGSFVWNNFSWLIWVYISMFIIMLFRNVPKWEKARPSLLLPILICGIGQIIGALSFMIFGPIGVIYAMYTCPFGVDYLILAIILHRRIPSPFS